MQLCRHCWTSLSCCSDALRHKGQQVKEAVARHMPRHMAAPNPTLPGLQGSERQKPAMNGHSMKEML